MIFYSASARGFYDSDIHGAAAIPADAVEVTPARHAELLDAQASEAPVEIVPSETGTPIMSRQRTLTDAERRAQLHAQLERETVRRIGAVADTQQQLLDTRIGGTDADARFAQIDAIRAARETIAPAIDGASSGELASLDLTSDTLWQES